MTARWWDRIKVARRTVIGLTTLGLLTVVVAYGAVSRASWIISELLQDWTSGTIAEQSDGVYQLTLGRVRFDWALRRVTLDSIRLTTLRGVNGRRPQPLPGLRLALYNCTISDVQFLNLVRSGGLIASAFGCREGILAFEVPRRTGAYRLDEPGPEQAALGFGERQAFLVFQQSIRLPSYAPRVQIARVLFPRLALDVRLPRTARGAMRFELERLQWNMTDLVIDPTDTTAAHRPLFSRKIEVAAHNFITHPSTRPGRTTAMQVGRLQISVTDSTLEVHGVSLAPIATRVESTARGYRRDIIRLTVGHLSAQGIDVGAFVLGEAIRARRIEVDSVRIDITSDKRLPRGPPLQHRTPQQWIADLDETLSLDSLRVRNGEVVYREHVAGREQPGLFTFTRIDAAATNVTHFVGRRTSRDPMILTARAHIQDAGQIDVRAVVPLDAPRFDMTVRGTLGPMSAPMLNPFVVETKALQIESGQVAGVDFDVAVRNGVAVGTVTPRFNDLSVSVTRDGSEGILGSGGIFGGAARGIANIASKIMLRANNPANPASAPRVGKIGNTFTPDQTLVAFLWLGVRDGLLSVVKK